MSEPVKCVCGHADSEHRSGDNGRSRWCGAEDCRCLECRAVLSWPDSEGWWWMVEKSPGFCIEEIVRVIHHPARSIEIIYNGINYQEKAFRSEDCKGMFTRVLEPNPFQESQ